MALHANKTRRERTSRYSHPRSQSTSAQNTHVSPTLMLAQLQTHNVLALQRQIGNRAVGKLLRYPASPIGIQRKFDDSATFLGTVDKTNADFQAMGKLMDDYNKFVDIDPKSGSDYRRGFGYLKQLDKKIYDWMNAATATYTRLADAPHYTEVEALRRRSQAEHEALTGEVKDQDIIPFDLTGMSHKEVLQLTRLWFSIRSGTGKIKLVGDPANQNQMLSDLIKLLDTPTGRKLLGFLNAGDPTEALTNIYLGQTKEQLPSAVKTATEGKLENRARSEAQPLVSPRDGMGAQTSTAEYRGPFDLDGTEDPKDFTIATSAADFNTATVEGKKGVILNGKKYLFNRDKAVGAFVTAVDGASQNENAAHHQIITPRFITLGHELGHAAHFRAGGTALVNAQIMQELTGQNPDVLQDVWQNSEELLTIQGWENSLRQDVGIEQRASHIPYTAGKRIERKWILKDDFLASFPRRDPTFLKLTTVLDFFNDLNRAIPRLDQDDVYNGLRLRLNNLKTTVKDNDLITWKRTELRNLLTIMTTRYKKKWFPPKDIKTEYNAIQQELRDNETQYTRVDPKTPFEQIENRIKDLNYKMRSW